MDLSLNHFDFSLDDELIAQHPAERRDCSRLMHICRKSATIEHRVFRELPDILRPGDLLAVNDTQVIPARFFCRRQTGGRIEGLFLRETLPGQWEAMLKNVQKCRTNEELILENHPDCRLKLREPLGQGRWLLEVIPAKGAFEVLRSAGSTPLPPYIRRQQALNGDNPADRDTYQTVYAASPGAVAAPTAGLHFTADLLAALADRGVQTTPLTLHVGMGTFLPVKSESLAGHKMHSEWYELSAESAATLNAARRQGRRIIAVGTTSVRVLETVARSARAASAEPFQASSGWTDIFIYPPNAFRAVDALITNFHLPRSTLLMLVSAFCQPGELGGIELLQSAYRQAVEARYRFYSYGDAMLIE